MITAPSRLCDPFCCPKSCRWILRSSTEILRQQCNRKCQPDGGQCQLFVIVYVCKQNHFRSWWSIMSRGLSSHRRRQFMAIRNTCQWTRNIRLENVPTPMARPSTSWRRLSRTSAPPTLSEKTSTLVNCQLTKFAFSGLEFDAAQVFQPRWSPSLRHDRRRPPRNSEQSDALHIPGN